MRSRAVPYTLFALSMLILVAPYAAHAAGIPFFGPIIPQSWNRCPASWGGVLDVINNIIDLGITLVIVLVAPLMFAYGGFLLVINPVNSSGKEQAKSILWSTVVGILIALASWLIVDAFMSVFYNGTFGKWSSLISGNGLDPCLQVASSLSQATPGTYPAPGNVSGVNSNGAVYNGPNVQCSSSNSACSVSALQGVGYTSAQANAMSCIAITESSGNPQTPNSSTGACGTFQITHGNWNNPALHQGSCSVSTSCNDPTCNMQTAYLLSQQSVNKGGSPYQPWTCSGCNAKAQSCTNQYDPGH